MDVELRHLRVVVLVAESGSVGRAARALKVSQPSLTAQLKRIETAFGGRLFDRSHTGVTPTPLGRYAVERARVILADVDHLTATVGTMTAVEPRSVRLGGFPAAPVSGIANRLRRHPDIEQVSIDVEWSGYVLLQQLESGRLDFAILREFPGFELRMPPGVQRRTIVEREAAIVAMAHDHRLARETAYRMQGPGLATRSLATEPIHCRLLLAWSVESPRAALADEVWRTAVESYDEVVRLQSPA